MEQDYTTSGFDNLLSRGDTPNLSGSLDTQSATNNSIPFDRTQVSGSQGDTFTMGGISMAAQDNSIILNDGTLTVNDTNTGASIKASSANLNYFDSNDNLVVQEGILSNGATGIRIVDNNGIGLAQFGRNKDGTTTLKIAKPDIEVSTATNDELIFNSSQDLFKIVGNGTATLSVPSPLSSQTPPGATVTVPHGLSITPAVLAYMGSTNSNFLNVGQQYSIPYVTFAGTIRFAMRIDSNNIYFDVYNDSGGNVSSIGTILFRYYILQETAS